MTTPWMTIRRDDGYLSDGEPFTYTYVEAAPAVFIVPVTETDEIVLIRQYRYTVDAWCLEVPAGGAGDRPGQSLEEIALEELREEVGGICRGVKHVADFYSWPSRSDQIAHVYLARDVRLEVEPKWENTERIEIVGVPIDEALRLARRGEIGDGQSTLALLLCEELLREMDQDGERS